MACIKLDSALRQHFAVVQMTRKKAILMMMMMMMSQMLETRKQQVMVMTVSMTIVKTRKVLTNNIQCPTIVRTSDSVTLASSPPVGLQ